MAETGGRLNFSWVERQRAIDVSATRCAEVLIIGGGVVGCSLATHAALLGLDCVLVERDDFAAGASSHSTGLAHAGLRYLAQGRIGYVLREARERLQLERLAPHCVRPFPFLFPVYRDDAYSLQQVRWGTAVYQALYRLAALGTGAGIARGMRILDRDEVLQRVPTLASDGLQGAAEYFVDARLDDARFTLGFAQRAAELGARMITRATVVSFDEPGRGPACVHVRDGMTGQPFSLRARLIVNAAGAWIDQIRALAGLKQPLLRNSSGIHLIVDRLADDPLIFSTRVPGQVFFVLPFGRRSLIGTTDTPQPGPPDAVRPGTAEVRQLIGELSRRFPATSSTDGSDARARRDYLAAHGHGLRWGIRPLLRADGSTLHASRAHRLVKDSAWLWSLPGVKLTAGRQAGEQAARAAWQALRAGTPPARQLSALPGGDFADMPTLLAEAMQRHGTWPHDQLVHLTGRYGAAYADVVRWADAEPQGRERVLPDEPWIHAEAAYAVHQEMALSLNDFLWRRTRWAELRDLPDPVVDRIAAVLGRHLQWSPATCVAEVEAFRAERSLRAAPLSAISGGAAPRVAT